MSLAIWDHTVQPATQHKWTHPALTPARGRYSIYLPGWIEGWVDLVDRVHAEMVIRTLTITHLSILTRQRTAGSRTRDLLITSPTPNHCTTNLHQALPIICRPSKYRGTGIQQCFVILLTIYVMQMITLLKAIYIIFYCMHECFNFIVRLLHTSFRNIIVIKHLCRLSNLNALKCSP